MNNGNFQFKRSFTIAGLLGLTTLVAVHCAFPSLLIAIVLALLGALVLGVLLLPCFLIIVFSSESKNGQLDVANNPAMRWMVRIYLVMVLVIYFLSLGIAIMAHLSQNG